MFGVISSRSDQIKAAMKQILLRRSQRYRLLVNTDAEPGSDKRVTALSPSASTKACANSGKFNMNPLIKFCSKARTKANCRSTPMQRWVLTMIFWEIPPQTRRMHVYTAVGKTRIRVTQWTSRIRTHMPPKSHVETDDDGGAMADDFVGDAKLTSAFCRIFPRDCHKQNQSYAHRFNFNYRSL